MQSRFAGVVVQDSDNGMSIFYLAADPDRPPKDRSGDCTRLPDA